MSTATKTETRSVWIYGPQGCGKTLNGQRLARHFGMKRVKEIEYIGRHNKPVPDRTLILSIDAPDPHHFPGVRVLPFDEAMRLAGFSRTTE